MGNCGPVTEKAVLAVAKPILVMVNNAVPLLVKVTVCIVGVLTGALAKERVLGDTVKPHWLVPLTNWGTKPIENGEVLPSPEVMVAVT